MKYTKLEPSAVAAARMAGGELIMKFAQSSGTDITRWSMEQVNEFIETIVDKYIEKSDEIIVDSEVPF